MTSCFSRSIGPFPGFEGHSPSSAAAWGPSRRCLASGAESVLSVPDLPYPHTEAWAGAIERQLKTGPSGSKPRVRDCTAFLLRTTPLAACDSSVLASERVHTAAALVLLGTEIHRRNGQRVVIRWNKCDLSFCNIRIVYTNSQKLMGRRIESQLWTDFFPMTKFPK